jgi:hypothetical protein
MVALAVEQDTEPFKASIAWGRAGAERMLTVKKPFVFQLTQRVGIIPP